ncbi:MAG: hypothetical protein M1821_009946 [Bathelium mastoideum]|nr:MAG: hypothetical protein M1821_009946 [Bathelium mastoideum]KAI9690285.1 MAG: hypothetical protein M1822_009246 [Bathelium mastoideum]
MRLLHTATLTLRKFIGKVPPYAILSHTWGKEEVLFHDIVNGTASRKAGYGKILSCCSLAASHGHAHVWIDTCCIDKSSSAELQEAINSMYRWYQNAAACYAYLIDVPGPTEEAKVGHQSSDLLNPRAIGTSRLTGEQQATYCGLGSPFAHSRWFTRGWTLQELIAPSQLLFYSRDWTKLGVRTDDPLTETVASVTGIRREILRSCRPDIGMASIAERMSWASMRSTTREEDIAYCLLGVFGVNMPLIYGEGKRAFMRLQEEIMKVSDDTSLFAWQLDGYRQRFEHHFPNKFGSREALSCIQKDEQHSLEPIDFTGLLAESPRDFLDSGCFGVGRQETNAPGFSLTNKGLRVTLRLTLLNARRGYSLINLGCLIRNSNRVVAIVLKRLSSKGEYARVFPVLIGISPWNALYIPDTNGWSEQIISVRQDIRDRLHRLPHQYSIHLHPRFFGNESRKANSLLQGLRSFSALPKEPILEIIASYPQMRALHSPDRLSASPEGFMGYANQIDVNSPVRTCGVFLMNVRLSRSSDAPRFDHLAVVVGLDSVSQPVVKVISHDQIEQRYDIPAWTGLVAGAHVKPLQPSEETDAAAKEIFYAIPNDGEGFPSNRSHIAQISNGFEVSVTVGFVTNPLSVSGSGVYRAEVWMVLGRGQLIMKAMQTITSATPT